MNIQGLELDKKILWDADLNDIDVYKHKTWIVSRVLTRGGLEDIRAILNFYTDDELKEAVLKSKTLNEKAMYFAAQYLNLDVKDFKCYEQIRSNPFLSAH
ncbi:DUF6922 domain-containing protein [Foetidibacter luteolus]|uniref:DUF6922 domain-containing protein n=1 Tax=Foetidibacter luteolus TaxID=2608880 RepID=UPI00129A4DC6|nr:hypothetical protein [Foetidibacter luteolus]